MRRIVGAGMIALALLVAPFGLAAADPGPTPATIAPAGQAAFEKGLHKRTCDVAVPGTDAVLHLGTKYYSLDASEAKDVLVRLWGNPPNSVDDVLGLVLPADKTVLDDSWGAVISWDDRGYVTDDDDIRASEPDANAERQKAGYPGQHVVGWAQPPSYDKGNHSLIWARDFKIDGTPVDSLNYDVRILGRKGVLSMNMLWTMPHLAEVRAAATDFGRVATFNPGATYADYNSSTDKAAGYGLAGLVAAGVGIAVAKKIGLLALLLPFGKWILIGLAAVGAAFRGFFAKLFGRKPANDGGGGNDAGIS
jgi:uncharacterized membrane-anchored protein